MNSKRECAPRFHLAPLFNRGGVTITIRCHALLFILALGVAGAGCNRQQQPVRARNPAAESPPPLVPASGSSQLDKLAGGRLPVYELKMDPNELAGLERSAFSNERHPATFIAGGETYEAVKVRYRGAWARSWPKKPLKIFFNHDKPFQGHYCLNLNSGWRDPAFVRETLAYHVYAVCGAPASNSRMVRIQVNGQFRGLYVEVEQPEKAFLSRFNLKGASVFKAISKSNVADERDLGSEESYRAHYEIQTQKTGGLRDLQSFCQELAHSKNALDFFTRQVDVEKYINYLAATTLIQHWDGYNKNHFLIYDGQGSHKWFVVPWDLDRTFGDYWDWSFNQAHLPILLGTRQMPGITGWNRIEDRFFSEPKLRSRFLDRLAELLDKEFTTEKLYPVLDKLESQISAEAALDRRRWPSQSSDLHSGIAEVKRFIEHRRAYLLEEVQKLRGNDRVP